MRATMQWAPLALLFLATVVPSKAQTGAGGERVVAVAAGAPLRVECALRVEAAAAWRLDGRAPPADLRASERAAAGGGGGGLVARLEAPAAGARHAGLYSCGPAAAQRVRVRVLPGAAAADGAEGTEGTEADKVTFWDVGRKLELTCNLSNPEGLPVVWSKNNTLVSAQPELAARAQLGGARLLLPAKTHEDDYGNYSCAVGGASRAWRVQGTPHAKMPANTNVVEGQKLKLTCRLIGKPYPPVDWFFSNDTNHENASWMGVREALGERATLADSEQRVADGQLTLEAAQLADAGAFACAPRGQGPEGAGAARTTLRVKDMYAALWPFLGICAEVFVLCAVILVYEKRRTKPEQDESDTDTHDQKKS